MGKTKKLKLTRSKLHITMILFFGLGISMSFAQDSIVIEAEDYKSGPDDIEVGSSAKASNGQFITQFKGNKTLVYSFKVDDAGTYNLSIFAANKNRDDSKIDVEVNDDTYKNVVIARSNDWNVFEENIISGVTLKKGKNTIALTQKISLSSRPDKLVLNPSSK